MPQSDYRYVTCPFCGREYSPSFGGCYCRYTSDKEKDKKDEKNKIEKKNNISAK